MKKVLLLFLFVSLCVSNTYGKTKTSYRNALIFAYSQANSVFEDDNIRLEIYNEQLWAKNKTAKTIFVDLSQCFIVHNGISYSLSDLLQDGKRTSKKGRVTSIDEFIPIPPNNGGNQYDTHICNMGMRILGEHSTSETTDGSFTEYDKRLFNLIAEMLEESKKANVKDEGNTKNVKFLFGNSHKKVKKSNARQSDPTMDDYIGTVTRHLTEDESINNIGASIAYAFSKRAENWTTVALSTWVCDVIFSPYYVEMPVDLTNKDKRGFGVKETKPAVIHVRAKSPFEFSEDRSPLIVYDWEGNFKKGTFKLSSTNITKGGKISFGRLLLGMMTYGATLVPLYDTCYKKVINFDGDTIDWGNMNYVSDILYTKQIIK